MRRWQEPSLSPAASSGPHRSSQFRSVAGAGPDGAAGGGRRRVDLVTVTCDPPPRRHTIETWLEYRGALGEPWIQAKEPGRRFMVPDAEGMVIRVEGGRCVEGAWRTAWHAYGEGPDGIAFDVTDGDFFSTRLSAEDYG